MRESYFHSEWQESWRWHYPDCHIYKIPDMPKSAAARFLPLKPYDFYAILDGKFYAMELKLKTKLGGFPFKDVSEWQLNNLQEAKANGGKAYIIINYRIKPTPKQRQRYEIKVAHLNTVFIIDVDDFRLAEKMPSSQSISFEELRNVYRIYKKQGFWDIPSLLLL